VRSSVGTPLYSYCHGLIKALLTHQRLRLAILDGDLAPEDLVKLSPNDLATDEQKDARDAESKASTLERRADYYQIARAGIQVRCMLFELTAFSTISSDLFIIEESNLLIVILQRANGIDPEAGGEYTCRKCKGNKTTHYSMQTRSADEPMTVFVGCLTCGNRWRCT
jgi:DNA-directed RNA polymerase subunit M/transcription elongation factor TFIIS